MGLLSKLARELDGLATHKSTSELKQETHWYNEESETKEAVAQKKARGE